MKKVFTIYILVIHFIFCLAACQITMAQTQVSPKYSVDREVKSLIAKGDTLIVAGTFSNVGIFTGGGALFKDTSDKPNANFPKIVGAIFCSTSDGNGGFYIYGNYRRESEAANAVSYRIEHVLSNNTFQPSFTIEVNSVSRLSTIVYDNGVLYLGGENVAQIGGQNAGNLSALNVNTQLLLSWIPAVNAKVNGIFISQNRLFVTGSFTVIGGQNRNGLAAVEINTGVIKPWNPSLGSGFSDIKFYNNKIIVGGGFSDPAFNNHACAIVDSVTGASVQYIFNSSNLYFAAGVTRMALRGDTLYSFSRGTFDTRVTAINLANGNTVIWKKFFNQTADATSIAIIDTSLYIVGTSFTNIYKTNLSNTNPSDIERSIKGAVRLSLRTGSLTNWFPDPVGLVVRDVNTMSIANKNIFIGGSFSHVNGLQRNGIMMLNTVTDEVLPFKIDFDYFSRDVNAIKLIDSTLYMVGNFSNINGQSYLASVLACNVRTGALLPWHPVKLGNAWVIEANSKYVFLGGSLTEPAGGSNRVNLFAIDRQTGALASWAPNPNNFVSTSSLHISKNRLYVGGSFNNISGQPRNHIASYDTASLNLTAWQPPLNSFLNITSINSSDTSIWIGTNSTPLFAGINPQTGVITNNPAGNLPVVGQVNSLLIKGRYVIAGGNFKINNNNVCNNIAMYDFNSNTLIPNNVFCQNFTNNGEPINSLAISGSDLFLGGNFTTLNSKSNATYLERIRYPIGFFDATVDSGYTYYPKQGGNGKEVTINFYGLSLTNGVQLRFRLAGSTDIVVPDSSISFPRPNEMTARVNFTGATLGDYDVIIKKPNGLETIFIKGFKVVSFIASKPTVQILGAPLIRTGLKSLFVLQVGGGSNCDVKGVSVLLLANGVDSLSFVSQIVNLNGNIINNPFYAKLDSSNGYTNGTRGYWLVIPRINAGETKNILFNIDCLQSQDFFLESVVGHFLPEDERRMSGGECLSSAMSFAANLISNLTPIESCALNVANTSNSAISIYLSSNTTPNAALDLGGNLVSTFVSCAQVFVPTLNALGILSKLFQGFGIGTGLNSLIADCSDIPNDKDKHRGKSQTSIDPNDKIGIGINSKHYTTGKKPLSYSIRFENLSSAGLPAQAVRIVDTLDKTKLDLSTFQPQFFKFGSNVVMFNPAKANNPYYVDLRPSKNLIVKVETSLNQTTGLFTAIFSSLNPLTLQPTTNPLEGFLPPNVNSPEGEGSIYFTINAFQSLSNNTTINNKALIYFDSNLPIATPIWSNALDKLAPKSKVNILPEVVSDPSIKLSWQGVDGESGIEKYNIYYAVNGGLYNVLLSNTNLTSTTFIGKEDSSYTFYSEAVDSVGNKETKNIFDAKTTISSDEVRIYPNPNNGSFIVQSKLAIKISGFTLYDMQGRQVDIKYTGSDNRFQLSVNNIAPLGMYILKIQTQDKVIGKKVFISR
jgi:hypothetical protein